MRALLVVLVGLMLCPAASDGATVRVEKRLVEVEGGQSLEPFLVFRALPAEANRVTLDVGADSAVVRDDGASLVAGEGCRSMEDAGVRCETEPDCSVFDSTGRCLARAAGLTAVLVYAGDANDVVTLRVHEFLRREFSVWAGPGDDAITAGSGEQTIRGGPGNDRLEAADIGARLFGGPGDDALYGARGDELRGDGGRDLLDGRSGEDTASFDDLRRPVRVDLSDRRPDGVRGEPDVLRGIENVRGGSGDDRLVGDGHANNLHGMDGEDILRGRGGDDLLQGGAGVDRLSGGAGDDVLQAWPPGGPADSLRCGTGRDNVETPYRFDVIAADCDSVLLDDVEIMRRPRVTLRDVTLTIKPCGGSRCRYSAVLVGAQSGLAFGRAAGRWQGGHMTRIRIPLLPAGAAALAPRRCARVRVKIATRASYSGEVIRGRDALTMCL